MYFNKKMRKAIFARPYSFYFLFFFFLYLFFTIWVNEVYTTYSVLLDNPVFGSFFILMNLSIAGFAGLNINLAIIRFNELQVVNGASGLTGIGVFLGVLGGACPGCIAGLFPAFIGIFGGVGYTLNALPFDGLELQVLSLVFLVVGARLLSKPVVCEI